jgi:subtilisin family serine protease
MRPSSQQSCPTTQSASTGMQRAGASSDGCSQTVSNKGQGIGIAVIDSGVDLLNPDLFDSDRPELGPVDLGTCGTTCTTTPASDNPTCTITGPGHGTGVAGIIRARGNDDGSVGIAPAAKLFAVKVYPTGANGNCTQATTLTLANGIDRVIEQNTADPGSVKIINLSVGVRLLDYTLTPSDPNSQTCNNVVRRFFRLPCAGPYEAASL